MRVGVTLAAIVLLALSGHATVLLPQPPRPVAVLATAQAPLDDGLAATDVVWPAAGAFVCPGACRLTVPDGASGELWLAWDGAVTTGFVAALDGSGGIPAFDAVRLGPVAGGETVLAWGQGPARLVVLPVVPGVPALAALVPDHLGKVAAQAPATQCLPEETALGYRTCLRFTTGLVNVGEAALSLTATERKGETQMTQRLPGGDRLAGTAAYHASHGHFHYGRFVAFDLYRVDAATQLRGAQVQATEKTGFCMVDYGDVADLPTLHAKTFWRDGCDPGRKTLAMGVNAGWYDIYRWFLPEQALDVAALPPGTYELVATIDPDGTVVESHALDNRASVVFSWDGSHATTLAGHGLYHLSAPQPS